jgi:hypothetical protein
MLVILQLFLCGVQNSNPNITFSMTLNIECHSY